ncbi:MAG: hypothetical protein LBD67_08400 [Candidatus Accumulibacter sp.]|nr:hypothetical protein [Accumulibacter sp.]
MNGRNLHPSDSFSILALRQAQDRQDEQKRKIFFRYPEWRNFQPESVLR